MPQRHPLLDSPPSRDDDMPFHPILVPKPRHATNQRPLLDLDASNDTDIDRFATLFAPPTPRATPILSAPEQAPRFSARPALSRSRASTQSSSDSEFGTFISVPPSQDPLHDPDRATPVDNYSLVYFDRFTAIAKTADERKRREVLDELLKHQDDPMYFINTQSDVNDTAIATATADQTPPLLTSSPPSMASSSTTAAALACPIAIPIMSTDDALAEALASDMTNPKLVRERSGSFKVAPSHSRSRVPLPPRLSSSASPPSISPLASTTSLPSSSPPLSSSTSTLASASASASASAHPAHATLSRLSSSLVSLLPRPRSTTPLISTTAPSSAPSPSNTMRFHGPVLTHGSPFASTPYIPPTGAPGFAGDRAWDRGFSEVLEREEKRGLVDPVGLGFGAGTGTGAETTAHARHGKGKGVTLVGRREGTVSVLNEEMADLIRPHLPALIKLPKHWTLLYSLDQHGISLNTLYARCEPHIPSRAHPNPPKGGLLVIQDADDGVFGTWVSEGIRLEKGGYYGSGEAFLWRYHAPTEEDRERGRREGRVEVYTWTGANEYVALCEPGFISFGGGDGHYGVYLDASLLDGSSAPCPTFGNPPLCASGSEDGVTRAKGEVSFECVGLEVWGIGSG